MFSYSFAKSARRLRRVLCGILLPLQFLNSARAQNTVDPVLAAKLQLAINALKTQYDVQGISAAAYIPGQGIWKGCTGVSYGSVPIDTSMLFCIGSITKTFTAAAVLKLVDAGQLSEDDTLGALLGPHNHVSGAITVRQLLSHTSGMGDVTNPDWEQHMADDPTKLWYFSKALDSFCTAPVDTPGSGWNYSNANYSLLGMVLEAKKSDSLHHILRHDLLQPQQLQHTFMDVFESFSAPIPHNWSTPTLNPALAADSSATPHTAYWSSIEPAGGYFSDASDLAKWGYDLYSGQVLSPSSLSHMLTFIPISDGYGNGYGLGAMRFARNGRTYWGHEGNFFGYAACMLYYPQDSICVSILVNQDCIGQFLATSLMNTLLINKATGLEEIKFNENIRITPNPANDRATVEMSGMIGGKDVSITDATGRQVYTGHTMDQAFLVPTGELANGLYLIRVCWNGTCSTSRLSVAH